MKIFSDKPGIPQFLKMNSVSENEVTLKWAEPEQDGGCDIVAYHVEIREASRRTWQRGGRVDATCERAYTARALKKNEKYMLRVAAENEVGIGEFAELAEPVLTKGKIGEIFSI